MHLRLWQRCEHRFNDSFHVRLNFGIQQNPSRNTTPKDRLLTTQLDYLNQINVVSTESQSVVIQSYPGTSNLPFLKLTWHLKMDGWNTSFLLGWPIFKSYVSLQECASSLVRWWTFFEKTECPVAFSF